MMRKREAWLKFILTRITGIATDVGVIALSYLAAFALRLDFTAPKWGWRATAMSYLVVAVVHIFMLFICGCYRLAWRRICRRDLPRYILAMFLSCVVLLLMRVAMPSVAFAYARPPYSITLICFFLATAGILLERYIWRLYCESCRSEKMLLERVERAFDNSVSAKFLSGRTVMVTGAGGSIGSEIVRQVAFAGARKILMVERCENALYEIDRSIRGILPSSCEAVPLMLDVNDERKMESLLKAEKPSVILHAAAYKHVPMVEMNPEEGWRNNTEATRLLAQLAKKHNVERFVLISTDKAVNPVSVMGKSKRAAEEAIMALNTDNGSTSFCAVRFGNVFGSSGSVVPLFREQIAKRLPVTVTHPEMRRYFMTIQEAVSLVLQASSRDERAVYTLDMGESVRILDLAEGMISQAGYRPYIDIPIIFTGIRPGEKLFEEIDVSEKSMYRTDMAKIYITRC